MKVTVDANILFSCLIKEGQTRRTWFNPELQLFAPHFILSEFVKYRNVLQKKSKLPTVEFNQLLELTTSQLILVSDAELKPYLPAAASLINDSKDWLYLACALKENAILWSNDKEFKKQTRIKTKTTEEMMKETGQL